MGKENPNVLPSGLHASSAVNGKIASESDVGSPNDLIKDKKTYKE